MLTNVLFTVLFLILKSKRLLWAELCPPKRYDEVPTPGTCECGLFCK